MEKYIFTVTVEEVCMVEANNSQEAMEFARKVTEEKKANPTKSAQECFDGSKKAKVLKNRVKDLTGVGNANTRDFHLNS